MVELKFAILMLLSAWAVITRPWWVSVLVLIALFLEFGKHGRYQ